MTKTTEEEARYREILLQHLRESQLHRQVLECLHIVFPQGWVAAGAIRNSVWDALSGIEESPLCNDLDVIYFSPQDTRQKTEREIENRLQQQLPESKTGLGKWSVKNQARMHLVNRDRPYLDCSDALRHWPETATAIAARINNAGQIELLSPFGLTDLFQMKVRPSPHFRDHKLFEYKIRQNRKNWRIRWRSLDFFMEEKVA
ncbi:nucleotidyltransferase family protein [Kiloniella laminariae]|uniref:nucleotidyltransferase family protein n=1 Tax=Kiloniella laminariae TaxID=454162 RepID=UPI000379489A|nr:nucleotidyltransferase family protein [Kiloniella laminariae]